MKETITEPKHEKCSILLNEVREKVRMLKEYGWRDDEIASALRGEVVLPLLKVTRKGEILLGETNTEVKMEPLVKAVYLLYLKHPEGIIFKHLPEHRRELTRIYESLRPWGLSDRAIHSIEDVTNPLLNSINEKCARIRRAFIKVLDKDVAEFYCITGLRGEIKKITLPRDLVSWEQND